MTNGVPPTNSNNNAGHPGIVQGVPGMQMAPAPATAYFNGAQQTQPGVNPRYNAKAALWTGYIQIGCGVVSIILGIISCVLRTHLSPIGTGLWTGLVFFLVTGIVGIVSAKRSYCLIITYMVMSIISSVAAGVALVIYSVDAADRYSYYNSHAELVLTINIMAILVTTVEFVTSITAAAFCCSGNCCAPNPPATGPVVCYYQAPAGYVMPQGMVAFTQHSMTPQVPGAPSVNNFVQQPSSMVQYPGTQPQYPGTQPQYPGTQPPMQWQPTMAGQPPMVMQPPMGQQDHNNPTGGQAAPPTQVSSGVEKPPPYI